MTYGSLGMIELHTSRKAALSKQANLRNDELVELSSRSDASMDYGS